MARLIAQTGHSFDIPSRGVSFGSDPANDVMIPIAYGVAPCHFAIWPHGEEFFVRDSGSGYGLSINGRGVQETFLQHGDRIEVGQLQLTYEKTPKIGPERAAYFPNHAPSATPVPTSAQVAHARPEATASANRVMEPSHQAMGESMRPSKAPVAEAIFEVVPAEKPKRPNEDDVIRLKSSDPQRSPQAEAFPKTVAPEWLPDQRDLSDQNPESNEFRHTGVTHQSADRAHHEKVTGGHVIRAAKWGLFLVLMTVAGTAKYWGKGLSQRLESFYATVFTNETPAPLISKDEANPQSGAPATVAANSNQIVRVDSTKPHAEVAPKFIFEQATTLFSLGFPQIEIFYVNQAQQLGLPSPKRYSTYLEKHFGLKIADLERLTSIQASPEKPDIVIITTQKRTNPSDWISAAEVQDDEPETISTYQLMSYHTINGNHCGLVALDERNFALGDPKLLKHCLTRKLDSAAMANISALWPDFLRKQPGAFLWTVKQDAQLQAQLSAATERTIKQVDYGSVASFSVRFGGEPPHTECFAIRDLNASPEAFADAATSSLRSMVRMISSQIESGGTRRAGRPDVPVIDVARTAATAELARGEEFVSIFLQAFYAPPLADEGPLKSLAQARTLAHAFNLAKDMSAPETARVRTVEEALDALQKGMKGTGRSAAMEFQVQEMDANEIRQIRKYLTFADGYLACRPDLDAIPENSRALAEEGRDRLNAETVLSLCPAPSGEKVVQIPDLAAHIRKSLARLKATRGTMALFGMPQLLDDEIRGVLKYITQHPNGRLGWKDGELAFNAWQSKSNPKAVRDASTLASLAGAAQAAGAKELERVRTVAEAIKLLAQGVRGQGQFGSTVFRCKDLSPTDMQAAAGLLVLDQGLLKLKETPSLQE